DYYCAAWDNSLYSGLF
nr:immunoglobulin light chain junction region [Macaca mulatta]MOW56601.1 immunoglobulin light chain junction region [Macaca mulatta]MOW56885.1 immunoglobulin light chain junction region [Macaca mulatta]MOW57113.1 immunoglobulin light chain junction region [Macaca mulatta]MOW57197.1 immunoglobulin light chain junction region [Macaca mulatta]